MKSTSPALASVATFLLASFAFGETNNCWLGVTILKDNKPALISPEGTVYGHVLLKAWWLDATSWPTLIISLARSAAMHVVSHNRRYALPAD